MDEKKYAVLIDSDNVSPRYIKTIIDEITKTGVPTVKRIYGDWTTSEKQSWKNMLLEYALTPVQQYSYTTGKNSTDSAMIIDAMDLLYTGNLDGFCLVSSDSDFTKLATRLREAGKTVIGMGMAHTPSPFVKTCTQFKYIDLLSGEEKQPPVKNGKAKKSAKTEPAKADQSKADANAKNKGKEQPAKSKNKVKPAKEQPAEQKADEPVEKTEPVAPETDEAKNDESSATSLQEIEQAIRKIIEDNDEESGLIPASRVGSILQNRYPDFDTRNYGCRRMTDLLKLLNIPTASFNDPNNPVQNAALLFIKTK